jgi:hypothetical protein
MFLLRGQPVIRQLLLLGHLVLQVSTILVYTSSKGLLD